MAVIPTTPIGLQGWLLLRQSHLAVFLLTLTSRRIIEMNAGIICACMPACAAIFRQPHRQYLRLPSFEPLKSWFSKTAAKLVSNKSTGQSSEEPLSEKGESKMRPSQESGDLVRVNSAASLNRNIPR